MIFRRLLTAIALGCAVAAPCHAQQTKAQLNSEITSHFPDNHIGAITPQVLRGVTSDIVNSIMPTAPVTSGDMAVYDGTTGLLKDGGAVPAIPNQAIVPGSGISLSGTCNGTSLNCTVASSGNVLFPSRADAAAVNLTGINAIQTLGYASPGDGGGAVFHNVGSGAFVDSYATSGTTVGGSGYTDGQYYGVILVNGSKPFIIGYAVVSGGAVTSISFPGTPGGQCNVGDVYTTSSIPGGSGFSLTITGCSTPQGSFTDAGGNHWQIVADPSGANALQFGCKGDWAGSDTGVTDNFNCLQSGLWFEGNMIQQAAGGGGGWWGGRFWIPQGTFMACGSGSTSLVIPNGVTLEGLNDQASVIKMCDAFNSGAHFITLGDVLWHFACFGIRTRNIQFFATRSVTASSNTYMIYSNCDQDVGGVYDTTLYAGERGGIMYQVGYGGASTFKISNTVINDNSVSPAVKIGETQASGLDIGSVAVVIDTFSIGGPSSGSPTQTGPGIIVYGGFDTIKNGHCESMPTCVEVNIPARSENDLVSIENVNAAAAAGVCSGVVTLLSGNAPNNTIISQIPAGSCTNSITNGGGTSTGQVNITKPVTCPNSGACS